MPTAQERLAKILETSPETVSLLDTKMSILSGQNGALERLMQEIDARVDTKLTQLGLTRQTPAGTLALALGEEIVGLEKRLLTYTGGADYNSIITKALELETPGKGLFIKKAKALEMLKANPPQNILSHFGYASVDELVEKEGLEQVFSALRFVEPGEWMNRQFIASYADLTIADFEERDVQVIVLNEKWLQAAEKFLQKKYHNVSHLKELGVIFTIPIVIDTDGELMRVFTLLLHYLNEVPFYSGLFRKFGGESDFADKLMSLLRGDVPSGALNDYNQFIADIALPSFSQRWTKKSDLGINICIIQRYLAKNDPSDPRLFIPHVNPEAEHWYKAQKSLSKLPGFEDIANYDFVGDYFGQNANPRMNANAANEELISFDLVDLVISIATGRPNKYLYHQREALWNKIFIEYLGRDKMNQLIEENIIGGSINF